MNTSDLENILNEVEFDLKNQTLTSNDEWSPSSWRAKKVTQDVVYEDKEELAKVLAKLQHLPPMISPREIKNLREQLSDVALGKSFLLQGGDCAELFEYCSQEPIENKIKIILQMSLILTWGARMPVVRIARMAGQYAKPRSKPTEIVNGEEVLSFRGDNVNGIDPTDRKPDPQRLLGAYFHSTASLNYIRTILHSGFADLHDPLAWDLQHFRNSHTREEYQSIANRLSDALNYMKVVGADASQISNIDLFTSHEALILPYEEALTRKLPDPDTREMKWYNTSAHFIWIGDRTRQIDGAHVEYFSGIENPIGIKCGPSMDPEELSRLLDIVNPNKEIGKVTLITRYGCNLVDEHLPKHIKAVQDSGHVVVWACDPMHGNTEQSSSGVKTRNFRNIIQEISRSFSIHLEYGRTLNGVHLEMTGDSVTECVGGFMELDHHHLSQNYQTSCDPRLNYEQSLDVALLIAKYNERKRRGSMGMM